MGIPHTSGDGFSPCRPPGDAILSRILVPVAVGGAQFQLSEN
jgi:hypothetical protein